MEENAVKVGERYAEFNDDCSEMWIKEVLFIAPTLDSNGERVVFCKVTTISRDFSNDDEFVEDTTQARLVEYFDYYDWVLPTLGKQFEGNEIDGIIID